MASLFFFLLLFFTALCYSFDGLSLVSGGSSWGHVVCCLYFAVTDTLAADFPEAGAVCTLECAWRGEVGWWSWGFQEGQLTT